MAIDGCRLSRVTRATNAERPICGVGVAVGHQQWCGAYRGAEGKSGSGRKIVVEKEEAEACQAQMLKR